MKKSLRILLTPLVLLSAEVPAAVQAAGPNDDGAAWCEYRAPAAWLADVRAAVDAGEVVDPAVQSANSPARVLPRNIGERGWRPVTTSDLFIVEDTGNALATTNNFGVFHQAVVAAANAVVLQHGDNFDFVGVFTTFDVPDPVFPLALYVGLINDVEGTGQDLFDFRAGFGSIGRRVQGILMMWNLDGWAAGDSDTALVTQLVLCHELEHRFGIFLRSLPGGRPLQGYAPCGRTAHWSWQVDAQGGCIELRDWVGESPATAEYASCFPVVGVPFCFNADVGMASASVGGAYSFPDLYLMGYATAEEMDAGASELRYLDGGCDSPNDGAISSWSSADLIAVHGPRLPNATDAQHAYRTAWVIVHPPGEPPTIGQQTRVVKILNQWADTFHWSTLGRGVMDQTLKPPFAIVPIGEPPTALPPNAPTRVALRVENQGGAPEPASGLLHLSIDGGPFETSPLKALASDRFAASFPALRCGQRVAYFVTMEDATGEIVRWPNDYPARHMTAVVADGIEIAFADDFILDLGWTVTNDGVLTDGAWERGAPAGGGRRGDPAVDFDGTNACFLTANRAGNSDVDGGATTLISPGIPLDGGDDAIIEYARWFTSGGGDDEWRVELSTDKRNWAVIEQTTGGAGEWQQRSVRLSDVVDVANGGELTIRFAAADFGDPSLVEAAVDAVRVVRFKCATCTNADFDCDADVDLDDFLRFADCYSGANRPAAQTCVAADFDADGDVDLSDFARFARAFTGPR